MDQLHDTLERLEAKLSSLESGADFSLSTPFDERRKNRNRQHFEDEHPEHTNNHIIRNAKYFVNHFLADKGTVQENTMLVLSAVKYVVDSYLGTHRDFRPLTGRMIFRNFHNIDIQVLKDGIANMPGFNDTIKRQVTRVVENIEDGRVNDYV